MPRLKLKKAKQINKPKYITYDRRSQDLTRGAIVAPVEIDDPSPFDPNNPDRPAKIIAFCSIRDNPLHRLFAHGHIDQALYDAGIIWQGAYERAEIFGA